MSMRQGAEMLFNWTSAIALCRDTGGCVLAAAPTIEEVIELLNLVLDLQTLE